MEKKKTDSGAKAYQRENGEDRTLAFRKWKRTLPRWLYAIDADLIEYRIIGDHLAPVGILELTRIDGWRTPPPTYFKEIIDRFENRDIQKRAIVQIGNMLCCDAYIVAYRQDLLGFWIYNLSTGHGWVEVDDVGFQSWLQGLKAVKRFDPDYVPPWFY
jgi:hypothetical protein